MPLREQSTIPAEITNLNLPHIEQVVLGGSGVLELNGIRKAEDIDLIMPRYLHQYLLRSHPSVWQQKRQRYTQANGRPFEVSSLRDVRANTPSRFDIWRWWYDASRAPRGRIYIEELREHSVQHALGFYVLNLEYVRDLKAKTGRQKDGDDVLLIDETAQP